MSLSNMMEVISKGSVDFVENSNASLPTQSRTSTSHSVRTDSQLSLEYLPPEVPYYTSSRLSTQDSSNGDDNTTPSHSRSHHYSWSAGDSTKEPPQSTSSTQPLYDRIRRLSDSLHTYTQLIPHHQREGEGPGSPSEGGEDSRDDATPTTGDQPVDSREGISLSSRNSTLVDEESLSSSNEELSIDNGHLSRDCEDSDSESLPLASTVHPETVNNGQSVSIRGLREDLENNEDHLGSDGGNQHSAHRNGNRARDKVSASSMDPKLHKALEKMRKLDERLANITKKEREVKRQRKILEQQLGVITNSECQSSTTLVAIDDCEDGSLPTSPVFVTRLDDNSSSAGDGLPLGVVTDSKSSMRRDSSREQEEEGPSKEESKRKIHAGHHDNTHGTNFIKRNIELASEAGAVVSMTESEKKRLEELLSDSSEVEDPYSSPVAVGAIEEGGFSYSREDLDKMRSIDSRLQLMLPPSDWESICSSTSRNTTPAILPPPDNQSQVTSTNSLNEATDSSSTVEETRHTIVPGEEVLHYFQISREESKRLKDIDERLLAIKEENERIEKAVVPLPMPDLQTLLDQCTRELQSSSLYGSHSALSSSSRLNKLAKDDETDFATSDIV